MVYQALLVLFIVLIRCIGDHISYNEIAMSQIFYIGFFAISLQIFYRDDKKE